MSMTLKEQKQKAVWIALHGTNKELEAHIEEVAITAREAERERIEQVIESSNLGGQLNWLIETL